MITFVPCKTCDFIVCKCQSPRTIEPVKVVEDDENGEPIIFRGEVVATNLTESVIDPA